MELEVPYYWELTQPRNRDCPPCLWKRRRQAASAEEATVEAKAKDRPSNPCAAALSTCPFHTENLTKSWEMLLQQEDELSP